MYHYPGNWPSLTVTTLRPQCKKGNKGLIPEPFICLLHSWDLRAVSCAHTCASEGTSCSGCCELCPEKDWGRVQESPRLSLAPGQKLLEGMPGTGPVCPARLICRLPALGKAVGYLELSCPSLPGHTQSVCLGAETEKQAARWGGVRSVPRSTGVLHIHRGISARGGEGDTWA